MYESAPPDSTSRRIIQPVTLTVTIDFSLPLSEMIEAGRYDFVDSNITAQNFPINVRESGEVRLHLAYFDRDIITQEVPFELEKEGLLPADLPELLALGATYPTLQRSRTLVALNSKWRRANGIVEVPILGVHEHRRDLSLAPARPGREWFPNCGFLAIDK